MSDRILLRFLHSGLIDVGGDDAKLEKLAGAADDLVQVLKKTPSKTTAFSLIAFDPKAPPDDPAVKEVIEVLANRWATYSNTFSGTPIAVIRPMLLDALVRAAKENDRIAVAFAVSARNALPYMEVGDERDIWTDVVREVEHYVDERAENEWATPDSITVGKLKIDAIPAVDMRAKERMVNQAALAKKILAASGPQDAQGKPTDGNPHWSNSPQPWATEFATRMAAVIASVVNIAENEPSGETIDLSKPIQTLATAVATHVDVTLSAVSAATAGLQRRANLLWWKEALFSTSARVTYRSLPPFAAAALMAFDLHRQVPTFSPASVAAFLEEAVLALDGAAGSTKRGIRELAVELQTIDGMAGLIQAAAELASAPVGRGPVIGLVGHPAAMEDEATFRKLFGVPADTKLTAPQWATWIFRELQAARATRDVPTVKRASKG